MTTTTLCAPAGREERLRRAAFGTEPAIGVVAAAAELGRAGAGVEERWWYAVALGGQGRYAAAHAELDLLARLRSPGSELWRSLAASTRASLLRQLGWHAVAARHDGSALALAGGGRDLGGAAAGSSALEARWDALTGLAADALGTGGLDVSRRLLGRVAGELDLALAREVSTEGGIDAEPALWRPRVRLCWVSAETAMAGGDGTNALGHAERGVALAAACPSARHRVKSDLVHAAALCVAGRAEDAADRAAMVFEAARDTGLVPLAWAATMLLGALRPGREIERARAEAAASLTAAGGVLAAG